jgi:hypothetical protein
VTALLAGTSHPLVEDVLAAVRAVPRGLTLAEVRARVDEPRVEVLKALRELEETKRLRVVDDDRTRRWVVPEHLHTPNTALRTSIQAERAREEQYELDRLRRQLATTPDLTARELVDRLFPTVGAMARPGVFRVPVDPTLRRLNDLADRREAFRWWDGSVYRWSHVPKPDVSPPPSASTPTTKPAPSKPVRRRVSEPMRLEPWPDHSTEPVPAEPEPELLIRARPEVVLADDPLPSEPSIPPEEPAMSTAQASAPVRPPTTRDRIREIVREAGPGGIAIADVVARFPKNQKSVSVDCSNLVRRGEFIKPCAGWVAVAPASKPREEVACAADGAPAGGEQPPSGGADLPAEPRPKDASVMGDAQAGLPMVLAALGVASDAPLDVALAVTKGLRDRAADATALQSKLVEAQRRIAELETHATANEVPDEIAFTLPPAALSHLDEIVAAGLYGHDRDDVAENLLLAELRRIRGAA